MPMKHQIVYRIFALLLVCNTSLAELLYIPEVELITRQADYIIKGVVLENQKVQIEKQYKGKIESEVISIPNLKEIDNNIKDQLKEDSHINNTIREAFGDEKYQTLKKDGLVGSTIVVFLQNDKDDVFSLKGKCLNSPETNYKQAAVKLVCGEKVFGFMQIENPGPYQLYKEQGDTVKLESRIAYDRPLLLNFGYASARGGNEVHNYLYLVIMNLSNERIPIDFPQDSSTMIFIDYKKVVLPKENWRVSKPQGFQDMLWPGGAISAHYELTNIKNGAPPSIKLQARKKYKVNLTITINKDGIEDKYEGKTTAEIRP
jgi:hypothetical protein